MDGWREGGKEGGKEERNSEPPRDSRLRYLFHHQQRHVSEALLQESIKSMSLLVTFP